MSQQVHMCVVGRIAVPQRYKTGGQQMELRLPIPRPYNKEIILDYPSGSVAIIRVFTHERGR